MVKIIKGKGGESSRDFIIQGIESCTPVRLAGLTPLIKELGFKKVTSHSGYLDIGTGANTLALHSVQAGTISAGLEVPTSVIVVNINQIYLNLGNSLSNTGRAEKTSID